MTKIHLYSAEMIYLLLFTLTFQFHIVKWMLFLSQWKSLAEKELAQSGKHLSILTCPKQKLLAPGKGQVGYVEDCHSKTTIINNLQNFAES